MFWGIFTKTEKGSSPDLAQDSKITAGNTDSNKRAQGKLARKVWSEGYLEILKKIGLMDHHF